MKIMTTAMRVAKRGMLVWSGFFLGGLLLTGAVQGRTLTYSNYSSPTSPSAKALQKAFDMVKQETDGKLTFNVYDSGTLTNGKTTLSGIANGVADGGVLVAPYTPSELPVNNIISDLMFYNDDVRVAVAASTDTILNDCPACLAEFRKHNVHVLSSMATSPYRMMCKGTYENGFQPEGLRMRAGTSETSRWVKDIGGVPVGMAQTEAYQGLQRNALDCALGVLTWLHTYSWAEVVGTVVTMPIGGYQGGSLMNLSQKAWETLDAKTQGILRKAAMYAIAAQTFSYLNQDKNAAQQARDKFHVQFVAPSAELKAKAESFKQSEQQVAIRNAKAKGVEHPEEVVSTFVKNVRKWKKLIGDQDLSEAQFTQMLIDNILKAPQH